MPLLTFPEYAPDVSPFGEEDSQNITNVYARKDGYGPVGALSAYTTALPTACRGSFTARASDGSIAVFAGALNDLYKLDNTTLAWTNVTKGGGGGYTSIPTADQWQFAQFGSVVIAVNINVNPQAYTLGSSTDFDDLAGSPPKARYIAVVNRFLVLSGMDTSTPYRIQWSGLNDITNWVSGVNSSDFQDFPDGGIVRSIGGGEYGLICQDGAIRRMIFAPGSSYVFQIERIVQETGILAPLSLVRAGDRLFYCASDGFKMVPPGGYPVPIGKERVDRTFLADIDTGSLRLMQGATDPTTTRVYWSYKSLTGTANQFDKILVYDYALDRWVGINGWTGEYITQAVRAGYTLEGLDSISSNIDTISIGSFDDLTTATQAKLAIFNVSHQLSFIGNQNMEAVLETSEQELDTLKRMRVQGARPDCDATLSYIAIATRERMQDAVVYSTEQLVTSRGYSPANVSTRLARAKLRVSSGVNWTVARGVEPIVRPEGRF